MKNIKIPKFLSRMFILELILIVVVAIGRIFIRDRESTGLFGELVVYGWYAFAILLLILSSIIGVLFQIVFVFVLLGGTLFLFLGNFVFSPGHIKKERKNIKDVIYYTLPKGYSPMEIALIYNRSEHTDIVPIALYYWASKGYLEIVEYEQNILGIIRKRVKFKRLIEKGDFENFINSKEVTRPDLEEELWNHITKKYTEEIDEDHIRRHEKVLDINDIMFRMDRSLKSKITPKYINRYENRYTNKFPLILILIGIGVSCLYLYVGIVLIVISLLSMFLFRYYMMLKEKKMNVDEENYLSEDGRKILEQVYGFRKYLMQVDDKRLEILTKENPNYYEKTLPYAIALGVGDEWVKKHTNFLKSYKFDIG